MDAIDRLLARFPTKPGTYHAEELNITISVRVEDDLGNQFIDYTRTTTQTVDNGRYLKTADEEFCSWFSGSFARIVCSLFRALVDRIRDNVVCGEQPDPEFPDQFRGPAPRSTRWNEPVSTPVHVPSVIVPLHGAQSRALQDPGDLAP